MKNFISERERETQQTDSARVRVLVHFTIILCGFLYY